MESNRRYTATGSVFAPELLATVQGLLADKQFRVFAAFLLETAGVRSTIVEEHDSRARYAEGYRGLGLTIETLLIAADFNNYQLMQQEYRNAQLSR